jgi:hypothetical protein
VASHTELTLMPKCRCQTEAGAGCILSLSTTCSLDVQCVSFSPPPTPAVWTCKGVSLYTASSMGIGHAACIPFHCQQYGQEGCGLYPFPPLAVWTCRVYPRPSLAVWTCRVYVSLFTFVKCFLNAGMMDCPASGQLGTGMNINVDDGTIPVSE